MSNAFTELEIILCSSTTMDLVWAQVITDPFLRRLILRYYSFILIGDWFWRMAWLQLTAT